MTDADQQKAECEPCEKNRIAMLRAESRLFYAERERDLYREALRYHGFCISCLGSGNAGGVDPDVACARCNGTGEIDD